ADVDDAGVGDGGHLRQVVRVRGIERYVHHLGAGDRGVAADGLEGWCGHDQLARRRGEGGGGELEDLTRAGTDDHAVDTHAVQLRHIGGEVVHLVVRIARGP